MPHQITPHIQQFYNDDEIWSVIQANTNLMQQFHEPDIRQNQVDVVLPVVRRDAGYGTHQFDLDLFIKHARVTELGQLELYRVKDFVRQKVDIGPVLHAVHQLTGVEIRTVAEHIKRQLQFLQKPENQDLPMAPAQMINLA